MGETEDPQAAASLARLNHILQDARAEWERFCRYAGPEHPLMAELYDAAWELVPLQGACELLGTTWLLQEVLQEFIEGPCHMFIRWPSSLWRILADELDADHPALSARIRRELPARREVQVDVECTLREARLLRLTAGDRG